LDEILASGVQQVRIVLRALALRHLGAGSSSADVAAMVRWSPKAIRTLCRRYNEGGLERALYEKARPGKKPLLEPSVQQRIVAMVCSQPPIGRARWSVRLIVEEALKREIVPRLGRETARILLQHHGLKPWQEKSVVSAGN
jgi:transposase